MIEKQVLRAAQDDSIRNKKDNNITDILVNDFLEKLGTSLFQLYLQHIVSANSKNSQVLINALSIIQPTSENSLVVSVYTERLN